jgi:hypothetical protein
MTMRAKDFFLAVRDAEHKIKVLRAKERKYREIASSITGMSETNIRTTGNRSRTESAAVRLVDVEDEIADAGEQYVALIEKAEQVLGQIKTQRYNDVLTYRYILGLSWRSVADEMRYHDAKSVYRVHGWALAEAQRILDKMGDM